MSVRSLVPAHTTDNRGLSCVQGLLQVMRDVEVVQPGEILLVLSTDRAAVHELPRWARRTGHEVVATEQEGPVWKRVYRTYIRKRQGEAPHGSLPTGSVRP